MENTFTKPAALLTVADVASIFRVHPKTVMVRIADGRLPKPFTIGGKYFWRPETIDAFLADLAEQAAA